MFTRYAIVLALSAVAFGKLFVTDPTATTTMQAGSPQVVTWKDDGTPPTLKEFGPAKIAIYVGSTQQQTQLQLITASLDVSTAATVEFTPDPSVGANSDQYFIRFESISLKDPAASTVPALAFSSKFTLTGMTGTFSPAVQAQLNATSTASGVPVPPAVASTAAPAKPAVPSPATPTTTPAAAPKPTTSAAAAGTPAGTAGANAAKASSPATTLSHSGFAVAAVAAAIGVSLC